MPLVAKKKNSKKVTETNNNVSSVFLVELISNGELIDRFVSHDLSFLNNINEMEFEMIQVNILKVKIL